MWVRTEMHRFDCNVDCVRIVMLQSCRNPVCVYVIVSHGHGVRMVQDDVTMQPNLRLCKHDNRPLLVVLVTFVCVVVA